MIASTTILGLEGLVVELGVNVFEDGLDGECEGLTTEMERGRADVWSWMAGGTSSGTFYGGTEGSGIVIDLGGFNTRRRARNWQS